MELNRWCYCNNIYTCKYCIESSHFSDEEIDDYESNYNIFEKAFNKAFSNENHDIDNDTTTNESSRNNQINNKGNGDNFFGNNIGELDHDSIAQNAHYKTESEIQTDRMSQIQNQKESKVESQIESHVGNQENNTSRQIEFQGGFQGGAEVQRESNIPLPNQNNLDDTNHMDIDSDTHKPELTQTTKLNKPKNFVKYCNVYTKLKYLATQTDFENLILNESSNKNIGEILNLRKIIKLYYVNNSNKVFGFETFDYTILQIFDCLIDEMEKITHSTQKTELNLEKVKLHLETMKTIKKNKPNLLDYFNHEDSKSFLQTKFSAVIDKYCNDYNNYIIFQGKNTMGEEFDKWFRVIFKDYRGYIYQKVDKKLRTKIDKTYKDNANK